MRKTVVLFAMLFSFSLVYGSVWEDPSTRIKWNYSVVSSKARLGTGKQNRPGDSNNTAIPTRVSEDVTIPSAIYGYPVTYLMAYSFYGCGVTGIVMPTSVSTLGTDAFAHCYYMTNVTISSSIATIPARTFYQCRTLRNLSLPEGVLSVGEEAFCGCKSITDVVLPASMVGIGKRTFRGCSNLRLIEIPSGVRSIGGAAFSGCGNLTVEVSPDNGYYKSEQGMLLTKDGRKLLHGTNGDVVIPHGVVDIDEGAFSGCSNLVSVTIPSTVETIGDSAFYDCVNLKSLTLPPSVTNVGNSVFANCLNLTNITFSEGIRSVGYYAFDNCASVSEIIVPASLKELSSSMFSSCCGLKKVVLIDGVETIESGAFRGCTNLTEISIPASVKTVRDYAFQNCSQVRTVTVPGWKCKIDFTFVTNLNISTGTTSIGSFAFSSDLIAGENVPDNCDSVKQVSIPSTVRDIDYSAFYFGDDFKSFSVDSENDYYKSYDGLLLTKDGKILVHGINGEVKIPQGVTNIAKSAFNGLGGLTSVSIPNDVMNIGDFAFCRCVGLTEVEIPDSVLNVGEYAFDGCSRLMRVDLPALLSTIRWGTFLDCVSLESMKIPKSVVAIEQSAFSYCAGLKHISIAQGVRSIESMSFNRCTGLEEIQVDASNADFMSKNNLLLTKDGKNLLLGVNGDVILPEGITNIAAYSFIGRKQLCSVTIPSGLESIGASAFKECTGILAMTFLGDAPSISEEAFSDVSTSCVAYVCNNKVGWVVDAEGKWNGLNVKYIATSTISDSASECCMITSTDLNSPAMVPSKWVLAHNIARNGAYVNDVSAKLLTFGNNGIPYYQSYILGMDPNSSVPANEQLRISLSFDEDGMPVVDYSPIPNDLSHAVVRKLGKKDLSNDGDWEEISTGHECGYNFFKVCVDVK